MGSQVIILKNIIVFLTLKNSTDPDEMLHYAAFHLGLYCYPKLINRMCVCACVRACVCVCVQNTNASHAQHNICTNHLFNFKNRSHVKVLYLLYIVYLISFSDNVYTCLIV